MGSTWNLTAPGGPHVGPIWTLLSGSPTDVVIYPYHLSQCPHQLSDLANVRWALRRWHRVSALWYFQQPPKMCWKSAVCPKNWTMVIMYVTGISKGIDHDTVCAGVVGTAIRHSTSCAVRHAAACGHTGRHNECCAGLQYQPRQRRPYKWSISILPRSQFYKKQGKLAFSTSCTAVRPHRQSHNDAWRQDS